MSNLACPYCNTSKCIKFGKINTAQYWFCQDCKRKFSKKTKDRIHLYQLALNEYLSESGSLRALANKYGNTVYSWLNQNSNENPFCKIGSTLRKYSELSHYLDSLKMNLYIKATPEKVLIIHWQDKRKHNISTALKKKSIYILYEIEPTSDNLHKIKFHDFERAQRFIKEFKVDLQLSNLMNLQEIKNSYLSIETINTLTGQKKK